MDKKDMSPFQQQCVDGLKQAGLNHGLQLPFSASSHYMLSEFNWNGEGHILLVADGELIFGIGNQEYYFEGPEGPGASDFGREFVEFVRLYLGGLEPTEARDKAKLYASGAI